MDPVFLTNVEKEEITCPDEKLSNRPLFFRSEIRERLSPLDADFDYSRSESSDVEDEVSFDISILKAVYTPFYKRFVELLPSLSLRLFSFTSKEIYIDSMKIRGLEVEF